MGDEEFLQEIDFTKGPDKPEEKFSKELMAKVDGEIDKKIADKRQEEQLKKETKKGPSKSAAKTNPEKKKKQEKTKTEGGGSDGNDPLPPAGDDGPPKARPDKINIEDEMRSSYIDYAMSVIVGRALPDVRDGLKPVHRRILYAMDGLGLAHNKPHKKSARLVGEVLGKYHPHGDMAVYDAMVRMAQDFSLRYMLVDGQGNFGSVDGDSAAAMRYTETRLSAMAEEMLADLEKETVDFMPNFDESLEEPKVLPSKFPNLLVNGSSGIAVGMATNIPPHNLTEVINGAVELIDNPEATNEDLMKIIKGPDFPTGAIICGRQGIKDGYTTGRGILTIRAKVIFEELKSGKEAIIINELPYQVNKANLVEQIAFLVKEKKLQGISDLRDESDRSGTRVYIELKRDTNKEIVLNQLYKHTNMQTTFGINSVALVDGEPRLLTLKDMLSEYIKHRDEVVTRRAKFDLKKAETEAHILEGLIICLDNLDKAIKLIRASKNVEEARQGLIKSFGLSLIQAQAILDMRLQKLTQLERTKIQEEYKAVLKLIAELKAILASKQKIMDIIKKELGEINEKYGDDRRTHIGAGAEDIDIEDLIADTDVVIPITKDGFIKRMPVTTFKSQHRGGRGISGMNTREEDQIEKLIIASSKSFILFFTNLGKVYKIKAYEIPETSRVGKGQSIANFLQLAEKEVVTSALPVKDFEQKSFLMMATKNGVIKKTPLEDFANIRRSGIIAIGIKDGDELNWVRETDGSREIMLVTVEGKAIRFKEKDVRDMGRAAGGVRGINLSKGDKVISMGVIEEGSSLLGITESGYGKRTLEKHFRVQHRGGKGIRLMKLRKGDKVSKLLIVLPGDEILITTKNGTMSRQKTDAISSQGRAASGVRVQRMDEGDKVVDIVIVPREENESPAKEEQKAEESEPPKKEKKGKNKKN
ncbi:MAG: DNA gyrase subunit A [Candidatus Saganbacteria bacterium]|nr:DNA gyrase subunit A [Candidatus Saganbacteria bacterium]